MDEQTRAMVLESLIQRWAKVTRCLREIPEGVEDRALLQHTWEVHEDMRQRCGWPDETPREWAAEDTYRVRVELSRLRLDLEGEWTPKGGGHDAQLPQPVRVATGACALTGLLLGWPDGTLSTPPPIDVWNLIGESMEVLNRASAECTSEIGESMELLDRAGATPAAAARSGEGWEFSLGPGA